MKILYTSLLLLAALSANGAAQNVMTIDATALVPAPQPVAAELGSARNPGGHTLGANSQYLTLDDKPWLPVMGEFHFSRYPAAEWEQEILKMKAAGVQIISTYIIWIHHEQAEGVFRWEGQRDLRRFVELCAKHGMYVVPRIGPWAHAEVRNGGLPDWVLKNSPVRQNNPVYLGEVQTFYTQIGAQLKGLLWKDGGPVIGVQIENEYRERGAGKGVEHIRTLKKMAIASGLDVPLYTVTGWDGASIPLDAALPVFGGYPDAPWDGSPSKLPPNEVYAFRFANRSAGSMGAIGGRNQSPASTYQGTPFLTAEVGDGIEDTYFRRPVVSADDVAAIPPIMLGSGANLLGYYMFHGGHNPDGGAITLQESQRTNYPTDVPEESYDFQAPLGEFGQTRESLRKLKLVHYFLNDFGAALAPMTPRAPDRTPADPSDASVARIAARTSGEQGFLFVSNFVRGLDMPARPGFQVEVKLPSGSVRVPEQPISLPAGTYGIWPVNLPLTGVDGTGVTLRYSTAQLFKRVVNGGQTYYFFFAIPNVAPEFAFTGPITPKDGAASMERLHPAAPQRFDGNRTTRLPLPGNVQIVLLPESEAESVWRVDDPALLLSTPDSAFSDGSTWTVQSLGASKIPLGIFGSAEAPKIAGVKLQATGEAGGFHRYFASVPEVAVGVKLTQTMPPGAPPPVELGPAVSWRKHPIPMAPADDAYKTAAAWKLELPAIPASPFLSDVFLTMRYQGDAARLYRGSQLLDDNFWNSVPWTVGLRELTADWHAPAALEVRVLPLAKDHPQYLEHAEQLHFNVKGAAAALDGVNLVPQYQLVFRAPGAMPE